MKALFQLCTAAIATATLTGGLGCLAEFPEGPAGPDARLRMQPDLGGRDAAELPRDTSAPVADGSDLADFEGVADAADLSDLGDPDLGADAALDPDAALVLPEICDDTDNDLDGSTDEGGVCGLYVSQHCQAWLGFSGGGGMAASPDSWGDCPASTRDNDGTERCVGTQTNGSFASLTLQGFVGSEDQFAVRFTCADPELPLAVWVQRHCGFALGWATNHDRSAEGQPNWAGCPGVNRDTTGNLSCAASGGDGRFHTVDYPGAGTSEDRLGVAFYCDDPEQSALAARIAAEVEVFLGFRYGFLIEIPTWNGHDTWAGCPAGSLDEGGADRCVGSQGDSRFHGMSLVDGILLIHWPGVLGIALKQR